MHMYLFRLIEGSSIEEAEEELAKAGLQGIFVIEDDASGEILLGGHAKKKIRLKNMTHSLLAEEKKEVDWKEQWALFAEDFKEGRAHIDLSRFGAEKTLLLTPGPGFGDLSHPTTYLMLEMMKGRVSGKEIVDIGTGSGVLALAALMMGATSAIGIDIDGDALKHAKENAKINGLEEGVQFAKKIPRRMQGKSVFLMNLIFPEQKMVGPAEWNRFAEIWIVTGILEEQKKEYLKQASDWGWKPVAEYSRSEWVGWIFAI